MLFFLAGYETTSGSMCWIFHELAHNPEIQEKLYEEVEETYEKYGVRILNFIVAEVSTRMSTLMPFCFRISRTTPLHQ